MRLALKGGEIIKVDSKELMGMPRSPKTKKSAPRAKLNFTRWAVDSSMSLAPFVPPGKRTGIYVLEFADNSRYVGRTVNIVTRYSNHTHGSAHHAPWDDVVAISFAPVPVDQLAEAEAEEIARNSAQGFALRNRQLTLLSVGQSPFDSAVTVTEQEHWATGYRQEVEVRRTMPRPTKLHRTAPIPVAKAVLKDLAFALEQLIPQAPMTEEAFWTLSDCPSTAGGRWATLNTGHIEFLVFPRQSLADKLPPEFELGWGYLNILPHPDDMNLVPYDLYMVEKKPPYLYSRHRYGLTDTLAVFFPLGLLEETITAPEHGFLEDAREFALMLMRRNSSNLFRRWHSKKLVNRVYNRILDQRLE